GDGAIAIGVTQLERRHLHEIIGNRTCIRDQLLEIFTIERRASVVQGTADFHKSGLAERREQNQPGENRGVHTDHHSNFSRGEKDTSLVRSESGSWSKFDDKTIVQVNVAVVFDQTFRRVQKRCRTLKSIDRGHVERILARSFVNEAFQILAAAVEDNLNL